MSGVKSIADVPENIKPDELIALCRSQPELLEQYRAQDEEFAAAIGSGNVTEVRAVMMKRIMSRLPPPGPSSVSSSSSSSSSLSSSSSSSSSSSLPNAYQTAPKYQKISMITDISGSIRPDQLIELCSEQPHLLQQFHSQDPAMGEAILAKDLTKLRTLIMQREMSRSKLEFDRKRELDALDVDSEEYQRKVADRIRLENVLENRNIALENFPESFGSISMLYVDIELNGMPLKAFVDSRAQNTVMSAACAERCNLMRLLDVAFAGEARGIGSAKILGRINITQVVTSDDLAYEYILALNF